MSSCIYKLYDGDELVYIGKTTCLSLRLLGHKDKTYTSVGYINIDEAHLSEVEAYMISVLTPKYNKTCQTAMTSEGEYLFDKFYASSVEHPFNENKKRYSDESVDCLTIPIKLLSMNRVNREGKDYKLSPAIKIVYSYCKHLCLSEDYTYMGEQYDIARKLGLTSRTVVSCLNTLREVGAILSTYRNGKLCYKLGKEL